MTQPDPLRFALYARTSTEDNQSPDDSLAWQHAKAVASTAGHGEIVTTYHDVGFSRGLPWKRRPEAIRLLDDLRRPDRSWNAVVIGEISRAFGDQLSAEIVLPMLKDAGIELWCPEFHGPIDAASSGGGFQLFAATTTSRDERDRLRSRVSTAMATQARDGRWTGGRPPFGYDIVPTDTPHPIREKAAAGVFLKTLSPNGYAPVIPQIFVWYLDGHGFKWIAHTLTEQGIPSPSAADPKRNPHRPGRAWAQTAVRAILQNRRYTGHQVYRRTAKEDGLLDPTDPTMGYKTTQRWQHAEAWIVTTDPVWPPLIDPDTFDAVQDRMTVRSTGRRGSGPRRDASRYLLRGAVFCARCGRRMQGTKVRKTEHYYRCTYRDDYADSAVFDHPKSLNIRETELLPVVDSWLSDLFADSAMDTTLEHIVAAAPESPASGALMRARRDRDEAAAKLGRLLDALEQGTLDHELLAPRIKNAQASRNDAQRNVAALEAEEKDGPPPLDIEAIKMVLEDLGGLVGVLEGAGNQTRTAIYEAAGVRISYDDRAPRRVTLRSEPVALVRVGGGTRPLTRRPLPDQTFHL